MDLDNEEIEPTELKCVKNSLKNYQKRKEDKWNINVKHVEDVID